MAGYVRASEIAPAVTKLPEGFKPHVPFFVPKSQAYYWTPEWRRGEAEADAEVREGKAERFRGFGEAVRWLDAE